MKFEGQSIHCSILDGGIAELRFDLQGDSVNKFNRATLGELAEAVKLIKAEQGVKGLLVTSGKDCFIVGADITEFTEAFKSSEEELVRSGGPGVDLDSAYRDFLAVNSRACLIMLTLADTALGDEALAAAVERRVEDGEGLEAIFAAYPDETARFDLGCHSPLEHGMELAPVALDGELGRSYARRHETGGVYVAMVTERDAPTADEVRGEVVEFAIEKQGPEVFNQWAAELLIRAEVEVNDGIGSWEPAPGTGDLPTVVANTG